MKRSEMLNIIENELFDLNLDPNNPSYCSNKILNALEKAGMKPPLSTCKFIEDTYNGGTKHGPVKHEWDEE